MGESDGARLGGRLILVLLTLYAVAMIAPDFLRTVRPLGSLGLTTNADGLVFEVQGPFEPPKPSRPPGAPACAPATGSTSSGCAAPSSATSSAPRRSRSGAA